MIKILWAQAILETIEIEVIEELLKIETCHRTKVKAGLEIIEEDSVEIEYIVDLGIEVDTHLGIKVKKEYVIIAENQNIL